MWGSWSGYRTSEDDGLCLGLDAANLAQAFSAGNAVVPQIARWIASALIRLMQDQAASELLHISLPDR